MGCLKSKPSQDGSKPLLTDDSRSYDTDSSHPRDASVSTAYRAPSESDVSSASGYGASSTLAESTNRKGSSAPGTPSRTASISVAISPSMPIRPAAAASSTPSLLLAPETSLARPVPIDGKALAAVVDRAEEDFLDVARSAADVEMENPNDPAALHFIQSLRAVEVNADVFLSKLAGLPRPASTAPEVVMSALASDPLPRDLYARAHAGTARVAQALDGLALADTGTPIVVAFRSIAVS